MKKLLALLLALMLIFSLGACDGSSQTPSSTDDSEQLSTDGGQTSTSGKADPSKGEAITFEELAVVDNDECLIRITGIDPENIWGYTIKAYFQNKSAEITYMFSVYSAAVNGVQCDPFFATEVAAGKKANAEISFADSSLEKSGITEFTDIEISFNVYDSNDWSADYVAEATVHVYPYGEERATAFVRESQSTDNVIADNDYVTVIVTGYDEDDIWGYAVNLFLLNKSDTEVMFTVDEASVNGFMADPFYAKSVAAEKCAFSSMSWSDATLEANGITSIDEIEFKLRAYDSNNWNRDDFVKETITLSP